ncbi:hypothetical protein [Micromonospora sp. SL4-19]|uniref:hypothetical protein n=1 Tax=Micromonospora sp. SL4-19 TaxID=3399129 RepID=UPI003A4D686D
MTIEQIRTVPPHGLTEIEAGMVPANSWKEFDIFGEVPVTKPPFTVGAGRVTELFLRYRVDCLRAPRPAKASLRIMLTVSMGSVRQEVEVPDVRPVSLAGGGSATQPDCR